MEREIYPNGTKLLDSSYIIDGFISDAGGYSHVYLVHRLHDTERKYAAKIVYRQDTHTDAFWKKFSDEQVTSLRIMNQENLVQTYDTFSYSGQGVEAKVFIMEYVEGIPLKNYLKQHGCLIPKVALNIFSKILVGIKALHNYKHKIIHHDLKPDNIILSYDLSKVTILDFGISTVLQDTQDALESQNIKCFTDEADINGTLPYIIPDVLDKKRNEQLKVTVQYDFYSLGVILYKMIMGKSPFDFDELPPDASNNRKLNLPRRFDIYNISSNPTITPTLENMIFRCLASKPEDIQYRYSSIEELIEDCNKAIASLNLKEDTTALLKPVNKRNYPKVNRFPIDTIKDKPKFYKKTWFMLVVLFCSIAIIVGSLLVFFVF